MPAVEPEFMHGSFAFIRKNDSKTTITPFAFLSSLFIPAYLPAGRPEEGIFYKHHKFQ